MLSVFPELFNYSYLAPFILRVALGLILIRVSYLSATKTSDKRQKAIDITQMVSSVFIIFGFLIQIASLIIISMIITETIKDGVQKIPTKRKALKILIIAVAVSLTLLGPGLFAIDLPL